METETVAVAALRQTGSVHCIKHYSSKSSHEREKQFIFVTATEEKTNWSAWMLSTPSFLSSSWNIHHPSRAESIVKVHYCSSLYGIAIPESVLLMTVASPNPVWLQWASPVDGKEGNECTTRPVLDCWARHFLCSHLLSPPAPPLPIYFAAAQQIDYVSKWGCNRGTAYMACYTRALQVKVKLLRIIVSIFKLAWLPLKNSDYISRRYSAGSSNIASYRTEIFVYILWVSRWRYNHNITANKSF